jgi:hypothetical protein
MGRVPAWDEYHGWHEYTPGHWADPQDCDVCGWGREEHISKQDYERFKEMSAEIQNEDVEDVE